MEVIVDGSYGWPVANEEATLGEIFDQVRRQAEAKKRVIVALLLDGESVARPRQEEMKATSVRAYSLLEVKTVDPLRLSGDTVGLLVPFLAGLERIHEEGLAALRAGDLALALKKMSQCVDGWDVLTHAIRDIAHLVEVDFSTLPPGSGPLEDRLRRLGATLVRFRTAVDLKESERLSAIIERELKTHLREWRGVLEALQSKLLRRNPE